METFCMLIGVFTLLVVIPIDIFLLFRFLNLFWQEINKN